VRRLCHAQSEHPALLGYNRADSVGIRSNALLKFVVLLLALSLASCRQNETKTASAGAFDDIPLALRGYQTSRGYAHL